MYVTMFQDTIGKYSSECVYITTWVNTDTIPVISTDTNPSSGSISNIFVWNSIKRCV